MTVLQMVERYIFFITLALLVLAVVLTNVFVTIMGDVGLFPHDISNVTFGLLCLVTYITLDEVVGGVMGYIADRTSPDPEEYGDEDDFR